MIMNGNKNKKAGLYTININTFRMCAKVKITRAPTFYMQAKESAIELQNY
jgi:hypothetical protein